jgi:hypothetical protein
MGPAAKIQIIREKKMQSNKQSGQRDEQQVGQEGKGKGKVQGEGDYESNRRYTESAKDFVESGKVDSAARAAKPQSEQEAADMRKAEQEGASHAKGGQAPSDRKNPRQG